RRAERACGYQGRDGTLLHPPQQILAAEPETVWVLADSAPAPEGAPASRAGADIAADATLVANIVRRRDCVFRSTGQLRRADLFGYGHKAIRLRLAPENFRLV